MISGNKLISHLPNVIGEQKPITADVFITDFCNNKCPYCTYERYKVREGNYTKIEDFKKYTERLLELGVQGIILTGGGEPTVNPDFDKITKYLEENEINYGINTNFNILKFIKPNYLKISLDGYDRESYSKNRGVDRYETVIENIKRYCDWKTKNNVKTNVGIQSVVVNIKDIKKFYEAHKNLPVDYIVFRPLESTGGKDFEDVYNSDVSEIIGILKELQKLDERVKINFKWFELESKFSKCFAHWTQLAINEKGEVMYCCHKPYEIIGHILDKDIMSKHKTAKTNILKCDVPCRLTGANHFMKAFENPSGDKMFI